MRTNHVSLIALLLCFTVADVFVAPAFAQGTGQIEGVVRDEQDGVLPGATLSLRNADSGVTRTVTSESDGRYVFPALLPGRYVLRTELSGFAAQEVRDAVITIGLELRRDFTLKLQAVAETVTVSADAPVVDTTKAEVGRTDALCELRRHDGVAAVNAWRAQNGLAAISEPQIDSSRINIMDARVSKAFTFGGRKVEVLAQAFGSSHSGSGTRLMRIVSPPAPRRATCRGFCRSRRRHARVQTTRATSARSFVAKFVVYLPAGLLSGELAAPPRNSLRPSASTRFRPTPLLVPSFA